MSDKLSPAIASQTLAFLGRMFYDTELKTLWERDTQTLPWLLRRKRRQYRAFAERELSPFALQADRDPHSFDVRALFVKSGLAGFQTEMLPPPLGTSSISTYKYSLTGKPAYALLMPQALKAEEFCAACGGLGLALLAHELGIAPLMISGSLTAILKWMWKIYREINSGEPAIAAFAITEPGAGSDVEDTEGAARASLNCRAKRVPGGWRLSGRKCFISDGAVAKWVTLFAAEQGKGVESWTCYLLDKSMPGFSVGRSERKMGQRAADASELILEDVFVPDERVIGEPGAGWAINRNVLNYSRPIVGAIALGIGRGAFEAANAFCRSARLGNKPLIAYQEVQLALADMLMKISAMRGTIWQAVRHQYSFQAAGSIAKVFCADTSWEVCNAAMELLGNHAFLHQNRVEKAARDARLTQIYEGTNQINRLAIFEGQLGSDF